MSRWYEAIESPGRTGTGTSIRDGRPAMSVPVQIFVASPTSGRSAPVQCRNCQPDGNERVSRSPGWATRPRAGFPWIASVAAVVVQVERVDEPRVARIWWLAPIETITSGTITASGGDGQVGAGGAYSVGSAVLACGAGEPDAAVAASGDVDPTGDVGEAEGTEDADAEGPLAALQSTTSSNGARQTNLRPEPRHREIAPLAVIVKSFSPSLLDRVSQSPDVRTALV
jgi:hypothetical protein